MPAYEYRCKQCDMTTIITRTVNDRDLRMICATCEHDMIRAIQSPSIAFKGAGFYSTDKRQP